MEVRNAILAHTALRPLLCGLVLLELLAPICTTAEPADRAGRRAGVEVGSARMDNAGRNDHSEDSDERAARRFQPMIDPPASAAIGHTRPNELALVRSESW